MKNICRLFIILVSSLNLLCLSLSAQQATSNTAQSAVKLGNIFGDYPPEELIADANFYHKKYNGKFLFRLCSANNSLPTVYGLYSTRLKTFTKSLERTGQVPPQNIYYVFGSRCENQNDLSFVELWWTPNDGREPQFDRRVEVCQLKISGYGNSSEQEFTSDKKYVAALNNLKKEVRAAADRSKVAGLVTVVYYNNYSPRLRRRIKMAEKLLATEIKDGLATVEVRKSVMPFVSEKEIARLKEKQFPLVYGVSLEERDCFDETQSNNSMDVRRKQRLCY